MHALHHQVRLHRQPAFNQSVAISLGAHVSCSRAWPATIRDPLAAAQNEVLACQAAHLLIVNAHVTLFGSRRTLIDKNHRDFSRFLQLLEKRICLLQRHDEQRVHLQ